MKLRDILCLLLFADFPYRLNEGYNDHSTLLLHYKVFDEFNWNIFNWIEILQSMTLQCHQSPFWGSQGSNPIFLAKKKGSVNPNFVVSKIQIQCKSPETVPLPIA